MSKLLLCTLLSTLSLTLAQRENFGFIVQFHPARVASDNRRNWIDNQLRNNNLPPLNDIQISSLRTGWDSGIFDGFAGDVSPDAAVAFEKSDDVAFVVPDFRSTVADITSVSNSPWGPARMSQQGPLQNRDPKQETFTYTFDDSAGEGVDIYVLDTGVRISHVEFEGRASFPPDATFSTGIPGQDIQGHGTHVAGIVAGSVHGVARSANIIAVKVMDDDGSGASSSIIAGINFVSRAAAQSGRPSVINLSITTPASQAIDAACAAAVQQGIHVIVAAGNEGVDASQTSPARADAVISVGATDINDQIASFSNTGQTVDFLAPGVEIISLGNDRDDALKTLDGTSMAAPMVSGLVAYLLRLEGNKSPLAMKVRLRDLATPNVIRGISAQSGTVNALVFNGAVANPGQPAGQEILQQQGVITSVDSMVSAFSALTATVARRPDDD